MASAASVAIADGARERRRALHRGVQRRAERPQVGRRAGGAVPGALRRDVRGRAEHHAGTGDVRVAGDGGQAEVGQHHPAVVAEQHVARLDVAVQDAGPVRGPQRVQHAEADLGDPPRRQRPVLGEDLSCSERDGTYSMTIHGSAVGAQHVEDADHVGCC